MENLIKLLTEQTQDLKVKFIEQNKVWAAKKFNNLVIYLALPIGEQYDRFEIKHAPGMVHNGCVINDDQYNRMRPESQKEVTSYEMPLRGEYGTKKYSKWQNATYAAKEVVAKGEEAFIVKAAIEAERHYEYSISKLAARIVSKGIDLNTMEVSTISRIDTTGNIETLITDANGLKVKAFTILAWGEVNAPHYRYLIK